MTVSFQNVTQNFCYQRIIVDHQHPQRRWREASRVGRSKLGITARGHFKPQSDGCSLPYRALDIYGRVVPLNSTINHRKAEPSTALALRGKERLEAASTC